MRTIETTAVVGPDHTLTVTVPEDVPPGSHHVVIVLGTSDAIAPPPRWADWPAHDVGPWPEGFTASREQLYDDDR